jgi:hypothetical protein
MIDPKYVTPGYWYVMDLVELNSSELYEIVYVEKDGYLKLLNSENHNAAHKDNINYIFIAPVPNPIGKPEEVIKELKERLNLPPTASTSNTFRAALALAKKVREELYNENK